MRRFYSEGDRHIFGAAAISCYKVQRQVTGLKRFLKWCLIVGLALVWIAGCGKKEKDTAGREEMDFTVVASDEIPEELAAEIEKNKKSEIRMAFMDGDEMYLIRGYGEQKTGGYSISVMECTEDEEKIYLDTRLIGPSNEEQLSKDPSYPCIVLKIEARDKDVEIQ